MGVLGQSRDLGAASVAPTAEGPVDKTGFFQNVGAGFREAVAGPHSTHVGTAIYQKNTYDQIIKALQAEGEQGQDTYQDLRGQQQTKRRSFRNPFVSSPWENIFNPGYNPLVGLYEGGDRKEIDQIWQSVQRVRQRKPDFLKDLPDEGALAALTDRRRQQDQAVAQQVTSRAGTIGTVGQFVGGMGGSVASLDPENMVGGGFGTAAGKTFARTVIKRSVEGAGANAAAAVIAVPGQMADAQSLGQEFTAEDAAHQVKQAAAIGAVFGGAHVIIPRVPGAVAEAVGKVADKAAAIPPVRDALVAASIRAGTVQDHAMLSEWQRAHNPGGIVDTSTPDERAAVHVVQRDVVAKEASPLHPDAAGHNDRRLDALAQSLGVDLAPQLPTTAPVQTPTVRSTSAQRPAQFSEAINRAEGSTRNPRSSADGYGNFIDSTWLAVAPEVTDTAGKSRAQILALRHDKNIASRATDFYAAQNGSYLRQRGIEDSPGNLSLAHFLGPDGAAKVLAADAETPVENLLPAKVVKANREVLTGKSASEVVAWAHKRIGAAVDQPVARADAVPDADLLDEADYSETPYKRAELAPDEVPAVAESERRIDAEHWDPIQSGELLIFERSNGERVIVDGLKRAEMAQRLYANDSSIRLPAAILREADGISEQLAQAVGMLKNVNLGKGSLESRAAALADMPEVAELLRAPEHHREIAAIAQLPYDQLGEILNGRAEPLEAARKAIDERSQKLSQQIREYWSFQKEHGHRRKPVQVVSTPDGAIRTWAASASEGAVAHQFRDGDTITRLKPDDHATLDTLLETLNGRRDTDTGRIGNRGQAGEPSGETGSRNAAAEADRVLSESNRPELFDHAVAARDAAEPFSDPVGEGAKRQTELLAHDLNLPEETPPLFDLPETGYRLSDEGDKPQKLADIMREADEDGAAAQALRDCLK